MAWHCQVIVIIIRLTKTTISNKRWCHISNSSDALKHKKLVCVFFNGVNGKGEKERK